MFGKNSKLRLIMIACFFFLGLGLVLFGWSLTGQLSGLLLMLLGVVFIMTALFVYNKPYGKEKKKR